LYTLLWAVPGERMRPICMLSRDTISQELSRHKTTFFKPFCYQEKATITHR